MGKEVGYGLFAWAVLIVIFLLALFGPEAFAGTLWFVETRTALGVSATFTGAAHDTGSSPPVYSYFGCGFLADQAGTAFVDDSDDGTNWHVALTAAIVANTRLDLNTHLRARYTRCREVNGVVLQTANYVVSSFTTD